MPNSYRVRTEIGKDKFIQLKLEQDYDKLELLSLAIFPNDVYIRSCAEFGVVCGRVFSNGGLGIPNARVSIFIPLKEEDEENPIISTLYPYKTFEQFNEDGYKYNLLPYSKSHSGHVPVGTFPDRIDALTNPSVCEVYDKYYKYSVKTNEAGDYMIFGLPLGQHELFMQVDLSDIGEFSLTPQDLIRSGRATEAQLDGTRFKFSENHSELPQIVTLTKSIQIAPFYGQKEVCDYYITRADFDLTLESNIEILPTCVFMGSMFSTLDKVKTNKRCKIPPKQGWLCDSIAGPGSIECLRQTVQFDDNGRPILENFILEKDGKVIDENGAWLIELPMNLDYVYTDEFGNKLISPDGKKGVPTKGKYRFKIKWNQSTSLNERNKRAYFLVPNIKEWGWTDISIDPNENTSLSYQTIDLPKDENFVTITPTSYLAFESSSNVLSYKIFTSTDFINYVERPDYQTLIPFVSDISVRIVYTLIDATEEDGGTLKFRSYSQSEFELLSSYAFSLSWEEYGNPQMINEAIQCLDRFYAFDFNKVYTVSQLIDRYTSKITKLPLPQRSVKIKHITDSRCEGNYNTFPTNDAYYRYDIFYIIISFLLNISKFIFIPLVVILHILAFLYPIAEKIAEALWKLKKYVIYPICLKVVRTLNALFISANLSCTDPGDWVPWDKNPFKNIKIPLVLYTEDGCQTCKCNVEDVPAFTPQPNTPEYEIFNTLNTLIPEQFNVPNISLLANLSSDSGFDSDYFKNDGYLEALKRFPDWRLKTLNGYTDNDRIWRNQKENYFFPKLPSQLNLYPWNTLLAASIRYTEESYGIRWDTNPYDSSFIPCDSLPITGNGGNLFSVYNVSDSTNTETSVSNLFYNILPEIPLKGTFCQAYRQLEPGSIFAGESDLRRMVVGSATLDIALAHQQRLPLFPKKDNGAGNLPSYTWDQFSVAWSTQITIAERLNLFNSKGKYFDNPGDMSPGNIGWNQIKVRFFSDLPENNDKNHFDSIICILVDSMTAITEGDLLSFNNPNLSDDPNAYEIEGTYVKNENVSVPFLNPNLESDLVVYKTNGLGEISSTTTCFKSDIEYYQIIRVEKLTDFKAKAKPIDFDTDNIYSLPWRFLDTSYTTYGDPADYGEVTSPVSRGKYNNSIMFTTMFDAPDNSYNLWAPTLATCTTNVNRPIPNRERVSFGSEVKIGIDSRVTIFDGQMYSPLLDLTASPRDYKSYSTLDINNSSYFYDNNTGCFYDYSGSMSTYNLAESEGFTVTGQKYTHKSGSGSFEVIFKNNLTLIINFPQDFYYPNDDTTDSDYGFYNGYNEGGAFFLLELDIILNNEPLRTYEKIFLKDIIGDPTTIYSAPDYPDGTFGYTSGQKVGLIHKTIKETFYLSLNDEITYNYKLKYYPHELGPITQSTFVDISISHVIGGNNCTEKDTLSSFRVLRADQKKYWDVYKGLANTGTCVAFLVRGVDPHSRRQKVAYDLSRLYGYEQYTDNFNGAPLDGTSTQSNTLVSSNTYNGNYNKTDYITEGDFYLNVPIQTSYQPQLYQKNIVIHTNINANDDIDPSTFNYLFFNSYFFTYNNSNYNGNWETKNHLFYCANDETTFATLGTIMPDYANQLTYLAVPWGFGDNLKSNRDSNIFNYSQYPRVPSNFDNNSLVVANCRYAQDNYLTFAQTFYDGIESTDDVNFIATYPHYCGSEPSFISNSANISKNYENVYLWTNILQGETPTIQGCQNEYIRKYPFSATDLPQNDCIFGPLRKGIVGYNCSSTLSNFLPTTQLNFTYFTDPTLINPDTFQYPLYSIEALFSLEKEQDYFYRYTPGIWGVGGCSRSELNDSATFFQPDLPWTFNIKLPPRVNTTKKGTNLGNSLFGSNKGRSSIMAGCTVSYTSNPKFNFNSDVTMTRDKYASNDILGQYVNSYLQINGGFGGGRNRAGVMNLFNLSDSGTTSQVWGNLMYREFVSNFFGQGACGYSGIGEPDYQQQIVNGYYGLYQSYYSDGVPYGFSNYWDYKLRNYYYTKYAYYVYPNANNNFDDAPPVGSCWMWNEGTSLASNFGTVFHGLADNEYSRHVGGYVGNEYLEGISFMAAKFVENDLERLVTRETLAPNQLSDTGFFNNTLINSLNGENPCDLGVDFGLFDNTTSLAGGVHSYITDKSETPISSWGESHTKTGSGGVIYKRNDKTFPYSWGDITAWCPSNKVYTPNAQIGPINLISNGAIYASLVYSEMKKSDGLIDDQGIELCENCKHDHRISMTNGQKIVMRTERLPSSDAPNNNGVNGMGFLLHQNPGFKVYKFLNLSPSNFGCAPVIPFAGGQVVAPAQVMTVESTNTEIVDVGADSSIGDAQVLDSTTDCFYAVDLQSYNVQNNQIVILPYTPYGKTGGKMWFIRESGCYNLVSEVFGSLRPTTITSPGVPDRTYSDIIMIVEWVQRLKITLAACFEVYSHTFSNNWINGTLYAVPFEVDTRFGADNKVTSRRYCRDLIYFNDSINNFFYRASPYKGSDFIGFPRYTNGSDSGSNTDQQPDGIGTFGKIGNQRNLLYPTTIIDLGPKNQYIQEITNSDIFDGYVADKIPSTTFQDVTSVINFFTLSRLINSTFLQLLLPPSQTGNSNGNDDPTVGAFFGNQRWANGNGFTIGGIGLPGLIDGDYSQSISVNSEIGVLNFNSSNYGKNDLYIGVTGANGLVGYPWFGVIYSGENQFRDYITPRRKIWDLNSTLPFTDSQVNYIPSVNSQNVPFYQWNDIYSDSNTIFGHQNNNFSTNETIFFQHSYQLLDRTNDNSKYFKPNVNLSAAYKGFIANFTADTSVNPSIYGPTEDLTTGFSSPDKITVGAPFHFYFGLIKGSSALDLFITKYVDTTKINDKF